MCIICVLYVYYMCVIYMCIICVFYVYYMCVIHMCIICVLYVYYMCVIYRCIIIFKLFRCRKRQVMSRPGSARRERSKRGGSATGPGLRTITVDTLWDTRCGTHFRHVSTSFNIFRHVDVGNWRLADRDMSRHRTVTCWRYADVSWHLALCRDALWRLWRLRGAPRGALEVSSRSSESRLACAAAGAANPIEKKLLQPASLPEFVTGCDWMWLPSMRNMSITWKAMQVQG